MSKTLTPSATSVTIRDSKGLKFLEVVGAAYNKAGLTEDEARRVNQAPGLTDLVSNHIAQYRHEVPPILKLVAKGIKVSGAKRFIADKVSLKEANIGWTGNNFDTHFLGKTEENVADATLVVHRLEKRSLDANICNELGQEREEVSIAHFFDLLKKQSKGEKGHLLVNGYANIAYIHDKNGNLWAVCAYWYFDDRYWDVDAFSVEDPNVWVGGDQVVSRDC